MRALTASLLLAIALLPRPAAAAASEWQDMGGGKARLLAQFDPASGRIEGVVEIDLKPGWKTYWREPGASGVPPQFDFSASRAVLVEAPAFPFPELIRVTGVEFAGYRGRVLFPFVAAALPGAETGALALTLLAGVCEEICIPATASMTLQIADMGFSDAIAARTIAEARRTLPGAAGPDFGLASARLGDGAIEIAVTALAGGPDPALFVEGPPDWRLVPARLKAREGIAARFRVDLGDAPAGTDFFAPTLRATLTQGGRGVQQQFSIGR